LALGKISENTTNTIVPVAIAAEKQKIFLV
jgi:hypothetical protein